MSPEPAFAQWLREELTRRGYPLGPRKGGIARFADAAGLSQATASRTVGGQQQPSPDTLRKIADLWGIRIGELFVRAGFASADELCAPPEIGRTDPGEGWAADAPADLRVGTDWAALPAWARWVWHTPGLPASVRWKLVRFIQAEQEAEAAEPLIRSGVPAELLIAKDANGC